VKYKHKELKNVQKANLQAFSVCFGQANLKLLS